MGEDAEKERDELAGRVRALEQEWDASRARCAVLEKRCAVLEGKLSAIANTDTYAPWYRAMAREALAI